MTDKARQPQDFEDVKARLEQIADAVSDDDMPLDHALDLFEEAVALSLQVGDLLELGIDSAEEPAIAQAGEVQPSEPNA